MVTETRVSEGPPAASENEPPASEPTQGQESATPSQEPGPEPEGNPLEKWLNEHPDQVEALLSGPLANVRERAQQAGFDQGQEAWKVRQRQEQEQAAFAKDYERATEALRTAAKRDGVDADEIVRLSERVAQAGAVAEHLPQLRREYGEAREELPYSDQWTAAELTRFDDRGTTGRREGLNRLRATHDAAWRIATERESKRWSDWLASQPASAGTRPAAPPNMGVGGAAPATLSDDAKLLDPKTPVSELIAIRARQESGH